MSSWCTSSWQKRTGNLRVDKYIYGHWTICWQWSFITLCLYCILLNIFSLSIYDIQIMAWVFSSENEVVNAYLSGISLEIINNIYNCKSSSVTVLDYRPKTSNLNCLCLSYKGYIIRIQCNKFISRLTNKHDYILGCTS